MSIYQHILVAVEADENEGRALLSHANQLARQFGASLTVLSVVEPVLTDFNGDIGVVPTQFTSELVELAGKRLRPLCAAEGLDPGRLRVEVGPITATILEVAQHVDADLIVLGHHPLRGFAALFSHTDKGVVGHAPCDVLAVRLKPAK
ncbi:universal stress protein [Stagnimonas aquatica]|uniref:universal stress protein n=1 Tax=Stagnimonas aquatica TaxID=2689987 RepID=UPI0013157853|nr:universal stress protein [Stagnimonas aquatica]